MSLTLREAQRIARTYGYTLRRVDGEVQLKPAGEKWSSDSVYFTGDLGDALGTLYTAFPNGPAATLALQVNNAIARVPSAEWGEIDEVRAYDLAQEVLGEGALSIAVTELADAILVKSDELVGRMSRNNEAFRSFAEEATARVAELRAPAASEVATPGGFVQALDQSGDKVVHAHIALDAIIDRTSPEFGVAVVALDTIGRYWFRSRTSHALLYLRRVTDARPDFEVSHEGSLVLLTPTNDEARNALVAMISGEHQWFGRALVVEPRYLDDLLEGIASQGFNVA